MLHISDNRRFLVHDNGRPFFYLGDTAWELFHRLDRQDADRYLADRADKGFTVIQAVVLGEMAGLKKPNASGDLPFVEGDIHRPDEGYFGHVDYIVEKAASLGLTIGMLPTWGSHLGVNWEGSDREYLIDVDNARPYGRFLGRRYGRQPIIWILGGDRPAEGNQAIWEAMAAGIGEGDGGRGLITYHPPGGQGSSLWFHRAGWLDFNMIQTGHSPHAMNHLPIQRDYQLTPAKPCMDGEPAYEYSPGDIPEARPCDDYVVRQKAYWALFAGAHGHTYGTHPIWQMYAPGRSPAWNVHTYWYDALDSPGARQMTHVKSLMLSRPFLTRVPDQSLLRSGMSWAQDYVSVTRDGTAGACDATYVMVYFTKHRRVLLSTACIGGQTLRGWWFNPRDGQAQAIGEMENDGLLDIAPPTEGEKEDWVLVLDDARCGYAAPGQEDLTTA